MNKSNLYSPVNLAFKNSYIDKIKHSEVLPPLQDQYIGHQSNDLENLEDFHSKIFEMDEEIKQLKNIEIKKQLCNQGNIIATPKKVETYANESTNYLIEEQNRRINELHLQLNQLKSISGPSKDIGVETNFKSMCNSSKDIGIETDKSYDLSRSEVNFSALDNDEIKRRIGNWSVRDPYQGPMDNLYFPFGSAGGGAPNRDSLGNPKTIVYGEKTLNSTTEEKKRKVLASKEILESLKHEMLEQKLRRLQDKQQSREPQKNLLELISRFQGGKPKRDPNTGILIDNHLNSSDITNNKLLTSRGHSPTERATPEENLYHNYGMDLNRAAEERQIFNKLSKLKEQQEVRQHIDSWDQIWGHRKKPYSLNLQNDVKFYPIQSNRSNHRNFYEFSDS